MQLVSKYKGRAACEPLLNMKEESFPDELAGQPCGALRDVQFPGARSSMGKHSAGLKAKEMVSHLRYLSTVA